MFSLGQLIGLYIFTLFIVYCILSKFMDVFRFNRYCKMWIKYYETIKSSPKWYSIPKPMSNKINKEETIQEVESKIEENKSDCESGISK